jgi:HK97 family phage prohead protease
MPIIKEREYRALVTPLTAGTGVNKRIDSDFYVEGYATMFNAPYELCEYDGVKFNEAVDRRAFEGADFSDVIMQYDHHGRVLARQSNKTLIIEPDEKGLFICADLSKSDEARSIYNDIANGLVNKMSWAFTIAGADYDRRSRTRTVTRVKKVYDVSAVSIPACGDTEISARCFAQGRLDAERQELLIRRSQLLKLKILLGGCKL